MLPVFQPPLERRPSTHSSGCCRRAPDIQAIGWSHVERTTHPRRGLGAKEKKERQSLKLGRKEPLSSHLSLCRGGAKGPGNIKTMSAFELSDVTVSSDHSFGFLFTHACRQGVIPLGQVVRYTLTAYGIRAMQNVARVALELHQRANRKIIPEALPKARLGD